MPDDQKQPILAAEFKPLTGAGSKRSLPISSGMLSLIVLAGVGIIIMMYLFVARAVVFQTVPPETQISVSGLSFNIGDNYLLLSGDYDITATADGYYPLIESITVDDAASQDVGVQLLPLPGNLAVISDLEDIQVTIDDQPAGTVPGTGFEVGATQKPGLMVSGGAEARSSAAVQAALTALVAGS